MDWHNAFSRRRAHSSNSPMAPREKLQVNKVLVVRVSGSAHLTNVLLSRLKLRSLITTAAEPAVSQSKQSSG